MKAKMNLVAILLLTGIVAHAQKLKKDSTYTEKEPSIKITREENSVGKKGELYASWGYNKEWYTPSNMHIKQPSLGNDYVLRNVYAHDHPGWDEGLFSKALSIPQYNYRLGYFFKDNWALEINFDHTKYVVATNQLLHAVGTMNHQPVDTFIDNRKGFLQYQLNNGANFLLANIVHRKHLTSFHKRWFDAALLLKGGLGVMIPHVQNTIDSMENNPHFQFGGFAAGVEGGIRATFFRYAYLEFTNKITATDYYNLNVYKGTARQFFATYEMILSIGASINLQKQKQH